MSMECVGRRQHLLARLGCRHAAPVLPEARGRAAELGPRWRNREESLSVAVLADKVVVVEVVQSGRSPSAAACIARVPPRNTVRSMATPPRICMLDGCRPRAGLERAGMPRRRMAASVRDVAECRVCGLILTAAAVSRARGAVSYSPSWPPCSGHDTFGAFFSEPEGLPPLKRFII